MLALQKTRLSSAKSKWEIRGALRHTETPLILPLFSACFNMVERPSPHKKKRYGDMGSPCRIPRVGRIKPLASPFKSTEYETLFMHIIIIDIQRSWKPNLFMILSKQGHSTRSKALLMSSLIAMRPSFPFLRWLMQCIVSNATRTLSVINLSGRNAL